MKKSEQVAIAAMEMEIAILRLQIALKGLDAGELLDEYLDQALKISRIVGESFSKRM